ncbi:MAG: TolC family protein, partial [Elusimicrobia bacterium]|nr:TolC family protein [Elusimicrobiota bacterium]
LFSASKAASIRSASAALGAAEASLRASSAALRSSLRQAFSALLFAQASLEAARRITAIRRHDSELVSLRYEAGRESKGNMLRARAQALQAQAAASAAERDLRTARREMARQLGRDGFEAFAATGAFSSAPPPPRPDDFRALLPLRTDVAIAEAALRSSRASRASADAAFWPALSANYSRTRAGATEFPSARTGWSAGATLSYALFGGGPTAAYLDAKSSRLGYEKTQSDLSAARQAALSDLERAWSDYADAADQVAVQDALLEAARQRNDEADIRYGSGLLSFDNWEVIVSDRVSTERNALSARRAAMDAETAWHRALGRALGE